jgi:hypothetical protein
MLSDHNVRKINDQIANELNTVDSWTASDDEKTAALDRIAKLKALLMPQPSREQILSELADAIADRAKADYLSPQDLVDRANMLFRRR